MVELKKKQRKRTRSKPTEPDIPLLQAAIKSLSKEVTQLKKEVREQRQEGRNIIIGVLIAFVIIVVTVAIEVILFHTRSIDHNFSTSNSKNYERPYEEENLP